MRATLKPILELTAADLMSAGVIAIPQHLSIPRAARLLEQSRISGAPVIDAQGRCVGVLSSADVVRWAQKCSASGVPPAPEPYYESWHLDAEEPECPCVRDYITRDVVAVPPGAPLAALARKMREAHIHRLIVTDGQRRPVGVVSTSDILAALAAAC